MPLTLAMLLLAAAFAVGLPWLTPRNRRPSLVETAVAAALGLCVAGIVFVFARMAGADLSTARLTVAVVMGGAALGVHLHRGRALVPRLPTRSDALAWPTGVLALLWLSPLAIGGWLMGRGAYPAMFFNIDTPFRLNHVHELLRGAGFPPQSIANAGVTARDHFGGPAAAAAVSLVTGLTPHAAMFAVVLPVAAAGAFAATVLLTDRLVTRDDRPLWLAGLLTVLFAWVLPVRAALVALQDSLSAGSVVPLRAMLGTVWRDPQSYNNYFEDVTHSLGRMLLLLVVAGAASPGPRPIAAAALAVVLLGQVKTGHVVVAGIVLAVACSWHSVRTRRLWPLVVLAAAGAASLLLLRVGGVGSLFHIVVEPAWMLRHFPEVALRDALTCAVVVGVPAAIFLTAPRRGVSIARDHALVRMVAVMAGVYGFFQVVGAYGVRLSWQLTEATAEVPYLELMEPLLQMPIVFACAAVALTAAHWRDAPRWRQVVLALFVTALVGPGVIHRVRGAVLMVFDPDRAHEHADNRALGEALGAVPVAGAVLATNDLRYPAHFFDRDLRQFQLSALRGHQAFGLAGYERYEGWQGRVALQRALTQTDAAPAALRTLAERGATHVVMHKRLPYPDMSGWPPVFESADYAVFRAPPR